MSRLEFTTWVFNNSIEKSLLRGEAVSRVEIIINGITMGYVAMGHNREFELPDGSYRVQCVLHYRSSVDNDVYYSDIHTVQLCGDEEFVFVLYHLSYDGSNKGFDCGVRGSVPLRPQAYKEHSKSCEEPCGGLCVLSFIYFPFGLIYWLVMRKKKPKKAKKILKTSLIAVAAIVGFYALLSTSGLLV